MSQFYRILLMIALLLAGILLLMHEYVLDTEGGTLQNPSWALVSLAFFTGLTALTHFISSNALDKSQRTFTNALYGGMAIRFFFSIFFIAIYLIVNEVRDRVFIVEFLIFYLIFTMFEIYHIVAKLRSEK